MLQRMYRFQRCRRQQGRLIISRSNQQEHFAVWTDGKLLIERIILFKVTGDHFDGLISPMHLVHAQLLILSDGIQVAPIGGEFDIEHLRSVLLILFNDRGAEYIENPGAATVEAYGKRSLRRMICHGGAFVIVQGREHWLQE